MEENPLMSPVPVWPPDLSPPQPGHKCVHHPLLHRKPRSITYYLHPRLKLPQNQLHPAEICLRTSSTPAGTCPRTSSTPAETCHRTSSTPAETYPRTISTPAETYPRTSSTPGSKPALPPPHGSSNAAPRYPGMVPLPTSPPRPKSQRGLLLLLVGLTAVSAGNLALSQDKQAEEDAKRYLKGMKPPKVLDTDPQDDVLARPLHSHDKRIYEKNPCELYQEDLESRPNDRRKKGCRHAADHLRDKTKEFNSSKCPNIGKGRCFAVDGKLGRCYVEVDEDNKDNRHSKLINNC